MKLSHVEGGSMHFDVEPGDPIMLLDTGHPDTPPGQALIIFPSTPFPESMKMDFEFKTEVYELRWALLREEDNEILYLSESHGHQMPGNTFTLTQG